MKTDNCPILRVGDIKEKLIKRFGNEVSFSSPKSRPKGQNKQEGKNRATAGKQDKRG